MDILVSVQHWCMQCKDLPWAARILIWLVRKLTPCQLDSLPLGEAEVPDLCQASTQKQQAFHLLGAVL